MASTFGPGLGVAEVARSGDFGRRRDTPLPAFRKMRVQASGNLFPAYQKRGEPDRRQMADMLIMHAVEALIIMPATRESSEDLREGLEGLWCEAQAEILRK
jgi:hypothetical protein